LTQLDLLEGERRREEGISRVAGNSAMFLARMRNKAIYISNLFGKVTSDDLRCYAKVWDIEPHHPNAWGAVFKGKNWKCIRRAKSWWPSNHARSIGIWKWEGK
jgi:hypothetical protein